jgi:outer membrane beta-barrel protein
MFASLALALIGAAVAQDSVPPPGGPVDIGMVRDSDISVVQKLKYAKAGRSELGLHVGIMPFDAYTYTPMAGLSFGKHVSEAWMWELALGGGYSLKNGTYKTLEGPAYGAAPDAYRYLGSALITAQWAPIYAKMNWQGNAVIHHDVYLLGGAGATLEQALLPDNSMAVAPTIALGIGFRLFLSQNSALRIQLRDDVLYEKRTKTELTQPYFIKQNASVTVGYTILSGKAKRS